MTTPGPISKSRSALAYQSCVPSIDRTILLVDDDPGVRGFAQVVLADSGYRIMACSTGEHALREASEHAGRLDLLLTDIQMPGMNGIEVANRVVGRHPGIKVIFMSGFLDHSSPLIPPTQAFLAKPFLPSTLLVTVRDVLGGSAPISPGSPGF